ncbi:MAG: 2-oxoglutarate dehydrogenase E1 component, partial [Dehalococcoidia bacterium]
RGRLNVLTHLLGKSYEQVLAEFDGGSYAQENTIEDFHGGWMRDVKYHEGGSTTYEPPDTGGQLAVALFLCPNPSHLELVDPVVLGAVRARQESLYRKQPWLASEDAAMAILVHGDASFPGQGIVAESINLSRIAGYSTGGTVHIIVNNQLGFTARPPELHSTPYASGLAAGFGVPVIHANADDPSAVLAAARLAFAYRERYHDDILIDLVGYRRYGHNEGDEPSFTQPAMYEAIRGHATVREQWARRLAGEGVVSTAAAEHMVGDAWARLQDALESARESQPVDQGDELRESPRAPEEPIPAPASVPEHTLRELNEELHRLPEGFRLHPKLERPFNRRREALGDGGRVEWAHAEALALASIIGEGVPVRLTGQDTERGTFSQRHAVLHDAETGAEFVPLASLPSASAPFNVHNSPLSEAGALGFEYGYSVEANRSLVLWEAQFGDFINNAQSIVDEFLASGEAKWGQRSGITLLLPHGYEGQGPNHSSARLERFLALAAESNMRVMYPTTAAQYFHLLRWQAAIVQVVPDPLAIMTPKSLLRHPLAASSLSALAGQTFHPVLADPRAERESGGVRLVVLCTGKVFTDLAVHEAYASGDVAILRIEQLYPFPVQELTRLLETYTDAPSIVWVQEEPQNMGAWSYVGPILAEMLGQTPPYIGRARRASPAEGSGGLHRQEQDRIVNEVFASVPQKPSRR